MVTVYSDLSFTRFMYGFLASDTWAEHCRKQGCFVKESHSFFLYHLFCFFERGFVYPRPASVVLTPGPPGTDSQVLGLVCVTRFGSSAGWGDFFIMLGRKQRDRKWSGILYHQESIPSDPVFSVRPHIVGSSRAPKIVFHQLGIKHCKHEPDGDISQQMKGR